MERRVGLGGLFAMAATLAVLAFPGFASAALVPTPPSHDFGTVDRYWQSPQQNFDFFNDQGLVVPISTAISGPDSGSFQINGDGCQGKLLMDGLSCSLSVIVQPQAAGPLTASLDVDDGISVTSVPLSATASTGTLSVNPDPISFDPQPWFFGAQNTNVNIQSQGFGTRVDDVQIGGPDAGLFSINYGNCNGLVLQSGNNCQVGVGFNPTGPTGPVSANLTIASDGVGPPQTIPITAEALAGPLPQVTPPAKDFGPVALGSASPEQQFTLTNGGDFPAQIQQVLIVSGTPQAFPVTGDSCTMQIVMPGGNCTFQVAFSPSTAGTKEASIFMITNSPAPVTQVGLIGQGTPQPEVEAVIEGVPAVGEALGCTPIGASGSPRYAWLRNGSVVAGATGSSYLLGEDDLGARVSCRITVSNPLGGATATSPETEPIAARDLSDGQRSFTGRAACRTASIDPIPGVEVRGTGPATPESPLTVSARRPIDVSLGGIARSGRTVTFTPRRLSRLADGPQELIVDGDSYTAVLAPCRLAGRVTGGRHGRATYALSGAAGIESASIRTPRLVIHDAGPMIGEATLLARGGPDTRFPVRFGDTRYNGIRVRVSRHRIEVSNAFAETGVVEVDFARGVVSGRGGVAHARATLQGGEAAQARFRTSW